MSRIASARADSRPLARPAAVPVLAAMLGALLGAAPAHAALQHFRLDPVHTRVAFQVSHAGFSNPIATFSKVSGTLDFDPDDWSTAHVDATLPIATLDLGDADWQRKILDRTFFDAARYPTAHFTSTRVERGAGNHARITGNLTLHGVTAPLVLEADLNALRRHPLTFKRTAGFSARGQLSRKAFGMGAWERVVGDAVTVLVEVEAVRDGGPAEADTPADTPADTTTGTDTSPGSASTPPTDPAPQDAQHADPKQP